MDEQSSSGATAAGLLRRLAALIYDCLPLLAILFAGTLALLPLTGGKAITPASQGLAIYLAYRGYLALLAFGYFGLAWTRAGQTLGMMAWRLRLCTRGDSAPAWPVATRRFALGLALAAAAEYGSRLVFAPGGSARVLAGSMLLLPLVVNFAWIPFDAKGRSLQDLTCGTRVLRTARRG
ncbi:MAG: RDD family protein [Gammaproteobacteria bacterium]|nr:RDD family protein [Gammaproteobacteria bacterium]